MKLSEEFKFRVKTLVDRVMNGVYSFVDSDHLFTYILTMAGFLHILKAGVDWTNNYYNKPLEDLCRRSLITRFFCYLYVGEKRRRRN